MAHSVDKNMKVEESMTLDKIEKKTYNQVVN